MRTPIAPRQLLDRYPGTHSPPLPFQTNPHAGCPGPINPTKLPPDIWHYLRPDSLIQARVLGPASRPHTQPGGSQKVQCGGDNPALGLFTPWEYLLLFLWLCLPFKGHRHQLRPCTVSPGSVSLCPGPRWPDGPSVFIAGLEHPPPSLNSFPSFPFSPCPGHPSNPPHTPSRSPPHSRGRC